MKTITLESIKNGFSWPTKQKRLYFVTLLVAMTASTYLALAANPKTSLPVQQLQDDASTALVVEQLNALQSQLKNLEGMVNKPTNEVNLNGITDQITNLSNQLNELRETDTKRLAETLNHTQTSLGKELHSIKVAVTQLDDKKSPIKYLPLKSLPFAIVSIDSIQQVPVASVTYDYKTIPLEKGDALAGWKVVSVDYSKQRIELENAQLERIIVTHEHVG